jgi:hypothetical protein
VEGPITKSAYYVILGGVGGTWRVHIFVTLNTDSKGLMYYFRLQGEYDGTAAIATCNPVGSHHRVSMVFS